MKKFKINYTQKALKDLQKLEKRDKKKVVSLISEIEQHPTTGTGKVEQLKHQYSEYWSRRINSKDRLIYKIYQDEILVLIVSAKGHYSNM